MAVNVFSGSGSAYRFQQLSGCYSLKQPLITTARMSGPNREPPIYYHIPPC